MAGIIDGEGSIGIVSDHRSRTRNYYTYLKVTSTDRCIMDRCLAITGAGNIHGNGKPTTPECRVAMRWQCAQPDVVRVILSVYPYLVLKKPQARLALLFKHIDRKDKVTQALMKDVMHDLNQRRVTDLPEWLDAA